MALITNTDALFDEQPLLEAAELGVVVPPQGGYLAKTCARKAHNDHDPDIDPALQDPLPVAVKARMEDGNVFEAKVGEKFRAAGLGRAAFFLPYSHVGLTDESISKWEKSTLAAMKRGVEFIWNARLPRNAATSQTGEPDFLVRTGKNAAGKWAYAPGDVKNHRTLEAAKTVSRYLLSTYEHPRLSEAVLSDSLGGGKAQLRDVLQLAHYTDMLRALGHGIDEDATPYGAVLGKEELLLWVDLDAKVYRHLDTTTGLRRLMSPREIYAQEFGFRLRVIRRAIARRQDRDLVPLVGPELKSECLECTWRTVCHDELEDTDHITLVNGITPDRAQVHYQLGVTTRGALAALDWRTAVLVDAGLDVVNLIHEAQSLNPGKPVSRPVEEERAAFRRAGLTHYRDVAALDLRTAQYSGLPVWQLANSIDQARVAKAQRVYRKRGVSHVSMPEAAVELDVDMENGADGLIYLWGVKLTTRSRGKETSEYLAFCDFSGTTQGERDAFVRFWTFLRDTQTRTREQHTGGFKAFCYSGAENRCLRALAKRYAGEPGVPTIEEVEDFIASDDWVDVLEVLSTNTLWPTETMGLKSVAKYVKFAWRDEDANGGASVTWYDQARTAASEEERAAAIDRILYYNEDDVTATYALRAWLRRLGEARKPGRKLPAVDTLDGRFRRPRVRVTPVALAKARARDLF